MRFAMRNISPGYAELWGNRYPGQRHVRLCIVMHDGSDGMWRYSRDGEACEEFGGLPAFTYAYRTRSEAVRWLKRWFLERQAEAAVEDGRGFSRMFWHCPCRGALKDMRDSGVFSGVELREWRERMEESC